VKLTLLKEEFSISSPLLVDRALILLKSLAVIVKVNKLVLELKEG
jgi:hypothetical protein